MESRGVLFDYQVVVIRSPKALRGILRRLFGIQKQ